MRRGFTLIELLVVIAIIAILAAILFPVFAKAREKARQTTCLSNLRQMATAVTMYVQDNEETFMPDPGSVAWATLLKDYNEGSLYDCPSKTGKGNNSKPEYGFNGHLFGLAMGDAQKPTETLMLADLMMGNPPQNYSFADPGSDVDTRHNKAANLAFIDGHVQTLTLAGNTAVWDVMMLNGWQMVAEGGQPLPWKQVAAGYGTTCNVATRGSAGYLIFQGTQVKQQPSWVTSWDLDAVTKYGYPSGQTTYTVTNYDTGWKFYTDTAAKLTCKPGTYTGALMSGAAKFGTSSSAALVSTVNVDTNDTSVHTVTLWTTGYCPWPGNESDLYVKLVSTANAGNATPDMKMSKKYNGGIGGGKGYGMYITATFTGSMQIKVWKSSGIDHMGAFLFD